MNKLPTLALLTVAISLNACATEPTTALNDASKKPPVPAAHGPSLASAIEAANAAIKACVAKDQKGAVSVVDSAGVLKVLLAVDGTSERGVLSSTNKAITALQFKTATSQLFARLDSDKKLAADIAANARYNARPGGVLLKNGDEIIGAIGVGGAKIDEECALAGIDKIRPILK